MKRSSMKGSSVQVWRLQGTRRAAALSSASTAAVGTHVNMSNPQPQMHQTGRRAQASVSVAQPRRLLPNANHSRRGSAKGG